MVTGVIILLTPMLALIQRWEGDTALWISLVVMQGSRSIGFAMAYASLYIIVNNIASRCAPHTAQVTGYVLEVVVQVVHHSYSTG